VIAWAPGGAATVPWSPRDYAAILDRLVEQSVAAGTPLGRDQIEAPVLLGELLLHPVRRRRVLVRNSRRFRSWPLAELLFERGREEAFDDPAQAESLARLGLDVVDSLEGETPDPRLLADLRARGLAVLGNTLRMRSDLTRAEQYLDEAETVLRAGTGDPVERGHLLDLTASLRKDQQRFDEANRLLAWAVRLYRSVGEDHRAGRSLLTQSAVCRLAGAPEQGIRILRQATKWISPEKDPRLALCIQHNLVLGMADLGDFPAARQVFLAARPLYARFRDSWTQRRRAWAEGKVLAGLGQHDEAERLLAWAQQGFVEQEIAYDAALVSLDLAAVYAKQGKADELKRLAAAMVPIFRARDIHREALAALGWFRQAVEMERATVEMVRGVVDYLRRARHNPRLRFEPPEG
jgi:tetratricopeptide (TPR) repeat protein